LKVLQPLACNNTILGVRNLSYINENPKGAPGLPDFFAFSSFLDKIEKGQKIYKIM